MLELFAASAWKVLAVGLLLGAGLPALFAAGVRFSAVGTGNTATAGGPAGVPATPTSAATRTGYRVAGVVCFVVVALAVVLGITVIVSSGFGKLVSFEHVYPTLVDKG